MRTAHSASRAESGILAKADRAFGYATGFLLVELLATGFRRLVPGVVCCNAASLTTLCALSEHNL